MKLTIAVAAAIMASTQLVQAAPIPRFCLFGPISCPPPSRFDYSRRPTHERKPTYTPADHEPYHQRLDEYRGAAVSSTFNRNRPNADHSNDDVLKYKNVGDYGGDFKKYMQDHPLKTTGQRLS